MENMKLIFMAETVVDSKPIAKFTASMHADSLKPEFAFRYVDNEACKIHRDVVRKDYDDFEDYVYSIQDILKSKEN